MGQCRHRVLYYTLPPTGSRPKITTMMLLQHMQKFILDKKRRVKSYPPSILKVEWTILATEYIVWIFYLIMNTIYHFSHILHNFTWFGWRCARNNYQRPPSQTQFNILYKQVFVSQHWPFAMKKKRNWICFFIRHFAKTISKIYIKNELLWSCPSPFFGSM